MLSRLFSLPRRTLSARPAHRLRHRQRQRQRHVNGEEYELQWEALSGLPNIDKDKPFTVLGIETSCGRIHIL